MTRPARQGDEQPPHAASTDALAFDIRRDFVEVSMDLTRLIAAFGPDMLMQVPRSFRGAGNALTVRALLSRHAAALPGFVAELPSADPLRRIAFRVEGARETAFTDGMRALVHDVLIQPRGTAGAATDPPPSGGA